MSRREWTAYPLSLILGHLRRHHPDVNEDLLREAYDFARAVHRDQRRANGRPYFDHPYTVALQAAEFHLDPVAVAAALLHDTLEDAPSEMGVSEGVIARQFGDELAMLVAGLTKLQAARGNQARALRVEELKRIMRETVHRDIRILMLKLFDRYHNVQSLDALRGDRRQRIAWETAHFYIPLARRLGLFGVSQTMADHVFRYLRPEAYRLLDQALRKRTQARRAHFQELVNGCATRLRRDGVSVKAVGIEAKKLSELFQLLKEEDQDLLNIDQVAAYNLCIRVASRPECYLTLSWLHEWFPHVPTHIRDFIGNPKVNGYRSLHTVIIDGQAQRIQVMIRTPEMELQGRLGLITELKAPRVEAPAWLDEVAAALEDAEVDEVFAVTQALNFKEINVFTPKGEVIKLPEGSTVLDFAYRVHTEVGRHAVRALVNGRPANIHRHLQNGDRVEIVTDPEREPDPLHLNKLHTERARIALRRFFRRRDAESSRRGLQELERFLGSLGVAAPRERLERLAAELGYESIDRMGSDIFYGRLSLEHSLEVLLPLIEGEELEPFTRCLCGAGVLSEDQLEELGRLGFDAEASRAVIEERLRQYLAERCPRHSLIELDSLPHPLPIELRECCRPKYDQEIVAVLSKQGVAAIHRRTCPNITPHLELGLRNVVEARWVTPPRQRRAMLKVIAQDRPRLLRDILKQLGRYETNIERLDLQAMEGQPSTAEFELTISEEESLNRIATRLRKIPSVQLVQLEWAES